MEFPTEVQDKVVFSSLAKVAEAFGVSIGQIRAWRKSSAELAKGRPYNVGKCAFELIAARLVYIENLSETVQKALAMHAGLRASVFHQKSEVVKDLCADPAFIKRIAAGDTTVSKDKDFIKQILRTAQQERKPLQHTESAVIAIACPKTAALFVDRVWTMDTTVPRDIEFRCGTFEESVIRGITGSLVVDLAEMQPREIPEQELDTILTKANAITESTFAPNLESMICAPLARAAGRRICPFVASESVFDKIYQPGDYEVLSAALTAIPVVDESKLEWKQVQELRADVDCKAKLKRFLHWTDVEMSGKPVSVLRDALQIRLNEYESSLRKHGVDTVMGTILSAIDPRLFVAVVDAWGGWGAVVGIGLQGVKVIFDYMRIKLDGISKTNLNEIAYIHEIGKLKE